MDHFFQLSSELDNDQSKGKQEKETVIQKYMMTQYMDVKNRLQNSVILSFELIGTSAIQSWIKNTVREQLKLEGHCLLDSAQEQAFLNVRKIKVTNRKQNEKSSPTIVLKEIPEEGEIRQAIQELLTLH